MYIRLNEEYLNAYLLQRYHSKKIPLERVLVRFNGEPHHKTFFEKEAVINFINEYLKISKVSKFFANNPTDRILKSVYKCDFEILSKENVADVIYRS